MNPQSTIAHYRITTKLGEGGMGEVWRATDTKLNRDVAIKLLPDAFAHDPDRMARFQREAQVLASLNHPNIASIYGVEERALVMELVDGLTLAERIAQGPIPLEEALEIARQLGDALEAAHESGIVHRDLKPANIKLTGSGRVKVLDFGLAKAMSGEPVSANPVNSPTLTMRSTIVGVILGTAAYMAPEQAKGKPVDRRADIWAFGVVLFEMLTGQRLFSGETVSDTLALVLTKEPDWERAPAETRQLLRACLEKDPKRRLRDIADAWRLIGETPKQQAYAPIPRGRPYPWVIAAAVLGLMTAALTVLHFGKRPASSPLVRFSVPPPDKTHFNQALAVSPDGRHLAFTATGADGVLRVWVRSFDSLEARPLGVGESASTAALVWSPDNRYIFFQSAGKLQKVSTDGGPPQTLCDAPAVVTLGGSWHESGTILFGSNTGPIMRVPAAGGVPAAVSRIDRSRGETFHTDPIFLPDGVHFLYFRHAANRENQGIYIGSLESKADEQSHRRVVPVDYSHGYAPARDGGTAGHLLFLREDTLLAQPFDERRLELMGDAVPVAEHIGTSISRALFSVSPAGVLAYRAGSGTATQLEWFDREGRALGRPRDAVEFQDVAISPDGTRVAYNRLMQGSVRQIWIQDLSRPQQMRVTFATESVRSPAWSPDGRFLAFGGNSTNQIYIKDVANGSDEEPIFRTESPAAVTQWSPDGRFLIYSNPANAYDVFALSNPRGGGERKAIPVASSETYSEMHGQVSPDSRWIAYDSNESGRFEVYVRPFPPGDGRGAKTVVSSNGGFQPRWRRDGKELFYVSLDGRMMAVDVKTAPGFEAETPRALFSTPTMNLRGQMFQYDVTRDGRRFFIVGLSPSSASRPATIVLNWQAGPK
jgi:Tol biopolymer transport system component/predicted Ser/Thr protein kinase